jgi:CPA1 family monovalent cation:H+ antiporter
METYSVIIILLAVAIGLSPIAAKTRLPYPIILLMTGIVVGFIPNFQRIYINPEVVFLIFLPPMLYDAAFNTSFKDFKANLHTISILAFMLVFVTTTVIAIVAHYYIPGLTWPLAFMLGAILSPPDAIAAIGVTKGVVPHRISVILEGESLINDASALVAFRFSVAAVAGSSFIFWQAGIMFFVALVGGFAIGIIIWMAFSKIISKKGFNNNAIVSLNLLLPFAAYLLAEEFHVSGVIAVVTVGLCVAINKNKFSKHTLIQSKFALDTAMFILGGLVFILIGLELPYILENIPSGVLVPLIECAFLIFAVALLIRMIIIFGHKLQIDLGMKKIGNVRAFLFIRRKNIEDLKPLSTKDCILIGWSGMRGIVSLAAALSLPLSMADGSAFPQRDTIIFLTVVVVIIMLTLQGLGLPILIKLLKIEKS